VKRIEAQEQKIGGSEDLGVKLENIKLHRLVAVDDRGISFGNPRKGACAGSCSRHGRLLIPEAGWIGVWITLRRAEPRLARLQRPTVEGLHGRGARRRLRQIPEVKGASSTCARDFL
jgi:hypothetical protein